MSKSRTNFDEKLAELSLWQEEQQKKLRAFQEAQKKLLDMEHQNILSTLRTHNMYQNNDNSEDKVTEDLTDKGKCEKSWNPPWVNHKVATDLMQLRLGSIKLVEPKTIGLDIKSHPPSNKEKEEFFCPETVENFEDNSSCQPRKFLRRGEGLARFRMTLDDFKAPPKIYKEKKIKTYLSGKPETNPKKINNRSVRVSKSNSKSNKYNQCSMANKGKSLPVKIYVSENKNSKCVPGKNLDPKPKELKKNCNMNLPKAPVQDLSLRPCNIATEWYNLLKEKQKIDMKEDASKQIEIIDLEKENKKDEKELHVFEVLEKKVDESSFCSTSSFVDKLMEQSLSSTPSKSVESELPKKFYAQGLKTLCSQFLVDEQLKNFEGSSDYSLQTSPEPKFEKEERLEEASIEEIMVEKEDESEDVEKMTLSREQQEKKIEQPQPPRVNKSLLQEYIRDFKHFKNILSENAHRIKKPDEVSVEEEPKAEVEISERDIALKLRRKGLQDNVKHLLNWDCPSRKRQPKRVVKKVKPKPARGDRLKGENEKIVFDSTLLKTRLDELEKEIAIFRKENQNLERLQRECNEEKQKLAKERKEFEKQMQEERERWEAKILEDQKKLQKEKTVFEKYCKQVKNQPNRQEREELANLKKELEKVTETLTTKEGRWGASQARLRNQIKALEKEISQLKSENQKLQKLSLKKVSFENEKSLNTKIINVINAELGKLRPTVVRTVNGSGNGSGSGRQPLSARSEKHTEKNPIRRIKSVPDIKGQAENDASPEVANDFEDKALGSVSTDSGIDTNGSRKPQPSRAKSDLQKKGSLLGQTCDVSNLRSPADEMIQSVVCEALFGKEKQNPPSSKIIDMKNRLERLTLENSEDGRTERESGMMSRLPEGSSGCKNSESEEGSGSWTEEEDESEEDEEENGEKRKEIQKHSYYESSGHPIRKECSRSSIIENKLEETSVWEKVYEDGSKEISYPNGNVKKIFPGHRIVKMVYYNGDIKETNVVEGSEKYYYAETKTWHTTYKDGLEVLEFPNGQTERRHPDGSTEIAFPNGCVRYCDPSGRDEWRFLDGTVIKTNEEGHKILLMPNGQKEIHTNDYKRREYPDGTIKILYSDGTQETRYATGRVRLKDKDGNLLMDSGGIR